MLLTRYMSMARREAKFPSPFDPPNKDDQNIVTLVERRMRIFSAQILEKPNWWVKVNDAEIVAKWRKEFVDQDATLVEKYWPRKAEANDDDEDAHVPHVPRVHPDFYDWDANTFEKRPKPWPRDVITDAQLDYVFDWLRWMAETRDQETGMESTVIPNVYQASNLVPAELKQALIEGASLLESVPEEQKDWHPGTNNQVLDLVHPSLHCFRIGKSFVKKDDDGSLYVPTLDEYMQQRPDLAYSPKRFSKPAAYSVSLQHQWLPTNFQVSPTGEVTALGYINNLHPDVHKPLYAPITSILERFIPLWEHVLSDSLLPAKERLAIKADPYSWYDGYASVSPSHLSVNLVYYQALDKWENEEYPIIPDPDPFTPPSAEDRVNFSLKGRKLQVIVKMANIVLTPENPEYKGGSWHVEGMENEQIVATGLYYYDCTNLTESKLSFRSALCDGMDWPYQQSDEKGWWVAYGINGNGGKLNQELGSVITKEGKCLAFPNVYQHRVAPFRLDEGSNIGHRKILCFFLVDPVLPILSTSQVPPQQYDWYLREMDRAPALQALPLELFDLVRDNVIDAEDGSGGVISMEKAKEERDKLMKERSTFVVEQNEHVFEMYFNMCEH